MCLRRRLSFLGRESVIIILPVESIDRPESPPSTSSSTNLKVSPTELARDLLLYKVVSSSYS